MHRLQIIAACALALSAAVGHAQTATGASTSSADQQPLNQAVKSVEGNLEQDPENAGLQNAAQRLKENRERIDTKRAEAAERVESAKAQRVERLERTTRMERVERTERVSRPELPSRVADRPGR